MKETQIFRIALGISIIIHGGLFVLPGERQLIQGKMKNLTPEVTYLQLPQPSAKEIPLPMEPKTLIKKIALPTYRPLTLPESKPEPKPVVQEQRIEIPKELEKNTDYQHYYETIREKIRFYAESNYKGYRSLGIVHLAFALYQNGELKQIQVFRENSVNNEFLIQLAIKSVKQSTPFPYFPKTIPQTELPFSVYIEFKKE